METVSVVIPTLNRPAALMRAIRSVIGQQHLSGIEIEVVVVDNSADGNARVGVETIAAGSPLAVRLIHEPRSGVASARNAGVAAATSRWVAFLDDDEEAAPDWIAEMVRIARLSGASAVFGTVAAKAEGPAEIAGFGPYFSRRFSHADGADITALAAYLGTNNSMFDCATCLDGRAPFDVSLDATGGEDSLLLKQLVLRGRRFAWAGSAEVIEWVPPRRLSWQYVRKRKFLSGQIRVIVQHKLIPPQWPSILFWMAVGCVQLGIGGVVLALSPPTRGRTYLTGSMLCAAGLGKILWMPRFRPTLYGLGLVS